MSKVISSGIPTMPASACAATTPVLGPDSTVRTGSAAAWSNPITPPFDCVRWGRGAQPTLGQPPAQPLDVAPHHGSQIGVHHGGAHPLELAELRRHLVARAHERIRQNLGDDGPGPLFMLRPQEPVQEADRHRGHAGLTQPHRGRPHRILVQRQFHAAIVANPLDHPDPQVAADQHHRLVRLHVIQVRPLLPPDLQQVAEPVRGDQPGPHPAQLDQRVGGDRGAVPEITDIAQPGAHPRRRLAYAVCNPPAWVVGRRWHLPDLDTSGGVVEQAQVGERAAAIHPNTPRHRSSFADAGIVRGMIV